MEIKFLWTEDMTVHNATLDAQHQELFQHINVLLDAIVNGTAEHIVDDMMLFFKDYMNQHLIYEEKYLEKNGYPDIHTHRQKHGIFVDKYHELKKKLQDGVDASHVVLEIENFMGTWLTQHILIEDRKYALYFHNKNKDVTPLNDTLS